MITPRLSPHPTDVPLVAVSRRSPALSHPIVRLCPEPIVDSEVEALGMCGLSATGQSFCGFTAPRGLGFFERTLLHSPQHAYRARGLVARLRWARRQAKVDPEKISVWAEKTADGLRETAPKLCEFFLDKVARIFVATRNFECAQRFFSRARDVERGLCRTPDTIHVIREFAALGLIDAATLSHEARSAARGLSPQYRCQFFGELLLAQAYAGVSLYEEAFADLHHVSTQCGKGCADADVDFVAAYLRTPAYADTAAGPLESIARVLPKAIRKHPESVEILLTVIPPKWQFVDYFHMLDKSGLWEVLCDDPNRLRRWFSTVVDCAGHTKFFSKTDKQCLEALLETGTALEGLTITIGVESLWSEDKYRFHPDFADVLCELGVRVRTRIEDPSAFTHFDLGAWEDNHHRDLSHLVACSDLEQQLLDSVTRCGRWRVFDALFDTPATRVLVARWLDRVNDQQRAAAGSFSTWIALDEELACFENLRQDPRLEAINPDACAGIMGVDPAAELAEQIRRGTIVEYSWPTFEKILGPFTHGKNQSVLGHFPEVFIEDDGHFYLINGTHERIFHTTENPEVYQVSLTDDDVFIIFEDRHTIASRSMWLSEGIPRPIYAEEFCYEGDYPLTIDGVPHLVTTSIAPGTPVPEFELGAHIGVGPVYVQSWEDDEDIVFVLPGTKTLTTAQFNAQLRAGTLPGVPLPEDAFGFLPEDAELDFSESFVVPATDTTEDSPLGVDAGLHYNFCFTSNSEPGKNWCITPLGAFCFTGEPFGVVPIPGHTDAHGGTPVWLIRKDRFGRTATLFDATTNAEFFPPYTGAGDFHALNSLPVSGFHHLRVRNEKVSSKMRSCTTGQAAKFLKNPLAILDFAEGDETLAAAIAGMIPGTRWLPGANVKLPHLDSIPPPLRFLYEQLGPSEETAL
ncbi:MAG: hypothetical protein Q4D85_08690 [Corynebacterium sp.]|uniref:hypothetical protein n=1 Tax=Corynebacterium sp. TaxID=1720 RepID=UPI0026DB689B|nr:hypothetical protein [Corynebacterium sp.]MDO5098823.1 hypothetical protein [Corynebacterium sp.]